MMLKARSFIKSIMIAAAAVMIVVTAAAPMASETFAATKKSSKTKVVTAYAVIVSKKNSSGVAYKTHVIYTAKRYSASQIRSDIVSYYKKNTTNAASASIDENSSIKVKKFTSKMSKSQFAKDNGFASNTTYHNKLKDKMKPDLEDVENMIIKGKYVDVVVDTYTKTVTYQSYKVTKKKSSKYRKSTKVIKGGVKGSTTIEKFGTLVNGAQISKTRTKKTVVAPVNQVVYIGTAMMPMSKGKTYSGTSGTTVVKYAKKFIGNPYVWGGTSLTKGADCSGFIYSVYRHFGLDVPRVGFSSVGKEVCSYSNFSVSKLKPGDIITYSGHYALYCGNGMVVHAASPKWGIVYTKIDWSGTPLIATRYFS